MHSSNTNLMTFILAFFFKGTFQPIVLACDSDNNHRYMKRNRIESLSIFKLASPSVPQCNTELKVKIVAILQKGGRSL